MYLGFCPPVREVPKVLGGHSRGKSERTRRATYPKEFDRLIIMIIEWTLTSRVVVVGEKKVVAAKRRQKC